PSSVISLLFFLHHTAPTVIYTLSLHDALPIFVCYINPHQNTQASPNTTMNYYHNNAQAFAQATLSVDMSALYEPFIKHLPPQARVLDAGCGAGRDAKAFAQMGFKVEAFDASEAMVGIAHQQGDFVVEPNSFLGFTRGYTFDGIWVCASLLHVPAQELPATFRHLASLLADNGVFYVSFKYGEGETQ